MNYSIDCSLWYIFAVNKRDYKRFAGGEYYHVYNRGVGKGDVFTDGQDYRNFIKRLRLSLGFKELEETRLKPRIPLGDQGESLVYRPLRIVPFNRGDFSLIAYCLMPNHFHLLLKQNGDVPVSKLLSKIATSYSMYFNRRHDRVGQLFQDVYRSIHIDNNEYLLWLSAYIHQNPVVAGLTWDLSAWEWSSYSSFLSPDNREKSDDLCDRSIILQQFKSPKE